MSLTDCRIDEADLTHNYTPSSNSENVQERKKNTLALIETKRPAGIRSNAKKKKEESAHTAHSKKPPKNPFLIPFLYLKKQKEILICSPQTLDKMFSTIHGRIFPRILCTKCAWNSINNAIVIWVTKVRNLKQSAPWISKIVSHYSCVKSLCG